MSAILQLSKAIARQWLPRAAAAGLLAVLLLTGTAFLLFAAYLEIELQTGSPSLAALLVGATTLVLSGLGLWFLVAGGDRLGRHRVGEPSCGLPELDCFVRQRPMTSTAIAVVAGIVLGLSPSARRAALALLALKSNER